MEKVIVLDRDGVINHDSDAFIKSADELLPVDGSIEAIAQLKAAGWKVAIATNQSGIARGYYSRAVLSEMHQKMQALLADAGCAQGVDWISYSPYLGPDNSPARKPGAGMLRSIEKALNVSLKAKPMVGDTLGDMNAALSMGMQPYLVKTGKGERTIAAHADELKAIPVYANLAQLVDELLSDSTASRATQSA